MKNCKLPKFIGNLELCEHKVLTDKGLAEMLHVAKGPDREIETADAGCLCLCLWNTKKRYKWVIASWTYNKEGWELKFCGDRPFDRRVRWDDLCTLFRTGQSIMDARYKKQKKVENGR